jgi:hypothetical protein
MTISDDDFEALLRSTAQTQDPVPLLLLDAAKAAFELRDLDSQLAELVADSWADAGSVAVRDSSSTLRMMTFASEGGSIEVDVEVDDTTGLCRLHGFVTDAVGDLVVERSDGQVSTPVVEGQFAVDGLARGAARLSIRTADGRRIATDWISL